MYNNKMYNTRNSGRYNTAGQFVPASEQQAAPPQFPAGAGAPRRPLPPQLQPQPQMQPQMQPQLQPQMQPQLQPQMQPQLQPQPQGNLQQVPIQSEDVNMAGQAAAAEEGDSQGQQDDRPAWMKTKLGGVRKIPNRERRRRQNETLRRLITPKNALMALNEMMPKEQLSSQFTVEAAQNQYFSRNSYSFCADLTLDGNNYKGYGENKLSARNNAAEQAIRDLIIKKMNKVVAASGDSTASDAGADEEALPMIQLASFALHKLFTEWEEEGHKVPHLKHGNNSVCEGMDTSGMVAEARAGGRGARGKAKGPRVLPAAAAAMHPAMLLSYMRPGLEYRELAAEGDKPQNMLFTMGIDVDGATYIGKASNKKEARKAAARAACAAIFNVNFDAVPTVVKPEAP